MVYCSCGDWGLPLLLLLGLLSRPVRVPTLWCRLSADAVAAAASAGVAQDLVFVLLPLFFPLLPRSPLPHSPLCWPVCPALPSLRPAAHRGCGGPEGWAAAMGTRGLGDGSSAAEHPHCCGAVAGTPLRGDHTPARGAAETLGARQGRGLASLNWSFSPLCGVRRGIPPAAARAASKRMTDVAGEVVTEVLLAPSLAADSASAAG